jgi:methyltransferase (TIGR00027 family)
MPELEDTVVFEVDHPASQQQKRERAKLASLSPTAKEVRFVAVDFTRDSLDEALAAAGHDAQQPTMWIWEGVVPYLTPAEVEATLHVVQRRSVKGSRLAIAYQAPSLFTRALGLLMLALAKQHVWKNEPLRSWWRPEQMRAVLERADFRVASDEDLVTLSATYGADLAGTARFARSGRIVVADRPRRMDHDR